MTNGDLLRQDGFVIYVNENKSIDGHPIQVEHGVIAVKLGDVILAWKETLLVLPFDKPGCLEIVYSSGVRIVGIYVPDDCNCTAVQFEGHLHPQFVPTKRPPNVMEQ